MKNQPPVTVGNKYRNPYDGPNGGPTITVILIEGTEAVCSFRYSDSPKNRLTVFVKEVGEIQKDWILIN